MSIAKTTLRSRPSSSPRIWPVLRYRFFFDVIRLCRLAGAGLLCGGMVLMFAGCLHLFSKKQAAEKPPEAPPAKLMPAINDYKILPTDMLEIIVFQEDDLKTKQRVSNEGTIVFPLLGIVSVGGMTPQQVAWDIKERLSHGYLIDPQVSVTVTEFSKRRFTVLGEVQKPGSYEMPDQQDITVLQAIGMAGGYTRIANPSSVTLMRKAKGEEQTIHLNARRMANGNTDSAFKVLPGDVITVAESVF